METKGRGVDKQRDRRDIKKQKQKREIKLNFIWYLGNVILCNSVV